MKKTWLMGSVKLTNVGKIGTRSLARSCSAGTRHLLPRFERLIS